MKPLLLSFIILLSLQSFSQKVCDVTTDESCPLASEASWYVIIPQTFVQKYQHKRVGVNIFNAVQTCNGCWVTSANAIAEFPDFFKEFNNDQLNANTVWLTLCNFCGGTVTGTVADGPKEKPVYPKNRVIEPHKTYAIVRK